MRTSDAPAIDLLSGSSVERIQHPEIVPLEVGDLWVDGAVIRVRMSEWGFVPALCRAIQILHDGCGATPSNGPLVSAVSGFGAVFLTGGRAREDELRRDLSDQRWQIYFGTTGVFTGMSGGFALLDLLGVSGWVLDLGQTQLKLATGTRLWTFPRDVRRLRATSTVPLPEIPAQRRRLREFIAMKLRWVLAHGQPRPQALVVALPARLAEDGTPITSDYAGLRGDRELIPDALNLAGLPDVTAFVLNDAELAAFSARTDPRLARFRKILVLTLGFGIGAALVCRSS